MAGLKVELTEIYIEPIGYIPKFSIACAAVVAEVPPPAILIGGAVASSMVSNWTVPVLVVYPLTLSCNLYVFPP